MTDENIVKAILEALKGSKYKLLAGRIPVLAPSYEGEVGKRLATLIAGELADGNFKHVEILVTDTKAEVTDKIKKAIK
jgi:hypothetical protein